MQRPRKLFADRGDRIFRPFSSEASYVEIIRSKEITRENNSDRGKLTELMLLLLLLLLMMMMMMMMMIGFVAFLPQQRHTSSTCL